MSRFEAQVRAMVRAHVSMHEAGGAATWTLQRWDAEIAWFFVEYEYETEGRVPS